MLSRQYSLQQLANTASHCERELWNGFGGLAFIHHGRNSQHEEPRLLRLTPASIFLGAMRPLRTP